MCFVIERASTRTMSSRRTAPPPNPPRHAQRNPNKARKHTHAEQWLACTCTPQAAASQPNTHRTQRRAIGNPTGKKSPQPDSHTQRPHDGKTYTTQGAHAGRAAGTHTRPEDTETRKPRNKPPANQSPQARGRNSHQSPKSFPQRDARHTTHTPQTFKGTPPQHGTDEKPV